MPDGVATDPSAAKFKMFAMFTTIEHHFAHQDDDTIQAEGGGSVDEFIRNIFDHLDENHDGEVSFEELWHCLSTWDHPVCHWMKEDGLQLGNGSPVKEHTSTPGTNRVSRSASMRDTRQLDARAALYRPSAELGEKNRLRAAELRAARQRATMPNPRAVEEKRGAYRKPWSEQGSEAGSVGSRSRPSSSGSGRSGRSGGSGKSFDSGWRNERGSVRQRKKHFGSSSNAPDPQPLERTKSLVETGP